MNSNPSSYELLIIGGSAGSLSMVLKLLPVLHRDMNIAMLLVFHRKSSEDTTLIEVLSTRTDFDVKEVDDKDDIVPGTIYVAPADYHVLVEKNKTLMLDASEKLNYSRPSIDVTFETAAEVYGKRLVCMLLSGANADGVEGLAQAQASGAYIIIQDPASAEVPYMPEQALRKMTEDLLLNEKSLKQIPLLFISANT